MSKLLKMWLEILHVLSHDSCVHGQISYFTFCSEITLQVGLVAEILESMCPRILFIIFALQEFPLLHQIVIHIGVIVTPFVNAVLILFPVQNVLLFLSINTVESTGACYLCCPVRKRLLFGFQIKFFVDGCLTIVNLVVVFIECSLNESRRTPRNDLHGLIQLIRRLISRRLW